MVLLDPFVDPDDILRANRSREKHYVFDHAFDQMATQVRILDFKLMGTSLQNLIDIL